MAAAYALLGQEDPLAAAAAVVAGYHAAFPLEEEEIRHLFALVSARLAVSVTISATRAKRAPGDPYVTVSEAPAWEALERLDRVHPRFAHYAFREACGLPPFPHGPAVVSWLEQARGGAGAGRGPARRAVPRPRPRRGQPLPGRRPAPRRDGAAHRAHLRRDEAGGRRGRGRALRRGARDLPLGTPSRREGARPTSGARCTSASTSSSSRGRPSTRRFPGSCTCSRTTPPRRTTGRSSSSGTRRATARPSTRSTAT